MTNHVIGLLPPNYYVPFLDIFKLTNLIDNGDGTYTVDIEIAPSIYSYAALGGITRGRKGAAIGALTGGLVGLLGSMTRKGEPIEIPAGTRMVIRLEQPLEILSSFHKVNQ